MQNSYLSALEGKIRIVLFRPNVNVALFVFTPAGTNNRSVQRQISIGPDPARVCLTGGSLTSDDKNVSTYTCCLCEYLLADLISSTTCLSANWPSCF